MPVSDAQKRASAKYNREKVTQKVVRFYPADADILRHAAGLGAFATYVTGLIRVYLERKA